MATSKKIGVSPLPVSFKEFSKNPVVSTLFICLVAIGYLYIDIKTDNKEERIYQKAINEKTNKRVDMLTESLRKCESALSAQNAKFETLEKLGKIPKLN